MSNFSVTILGASGALPAFGRFPSAQYIQVRNHHFLLDCGEAAQWQLSTLSVNIHRISRIFITHLHGDHYLGLMGLLFSMHLQRRTSELHIHAPRGLDEIITAQLKHARSYPHFDIRFHPTPTATQTIFEDDALTVATIPLIHRIPTTGFLIREKTGDLRIKKELLTAEIPVSAIAEMKAGRDVYDDNGKVKYRHNEFTLPPHAPRSYAYCSDTRPSEEIIPVIEGVDLLYHEATFMEDDKQKAVESFHSTSLDAARIASMARVKRLLLGHFSARYKDLGPLLREARSVFPATEVAREGDIIEV